MIRRALGAELLKLRFSTILWISAAVAVVFPILIGLVMVGVLGADSAIVVEASVEGFLMQFELVVAIGGLIGFGFLFSWIFGREFADGTVTDLLALPVGRLEIVGAKFVVAALWCALLAGVHFAIGVGFTWLALGEMTTGALAAGLGGFTMTTRPLGPRRLRGECGPRVPGATRVRGPDDRDRAVVGSGWRRRLLPLGGAWTLRRRPRTRRDATRSVQSAPTLRGWSSRGDDDGMVVVALALTPLFLSATIRCAYLAAE